MNITVYLPSGTISVVVPNEDCHTIDNTLCIMIPCLESLVQHVDRGVYYEFFTSGREDPCKYYVPLDVSGIFALASTSPTNQYMLNSCLQYVDKNDISRLLMRYMTRFNIPDECGYTPLYVACIHRNHAIVQDLLDKGADPYQHCSGYLSSFDYCNMTKCVSPIYKQIMNMFYHR